MNRKKKPDMLDYLRLLLKSRNEKQSWERGDAT